MCSGFEAIPKFIGKASRFIRPRQTAGFFVINDIIQTGQGAEIGRQARFRTVYS